MALSNTTQRLTHHSGIPMIYHGSVEIARLSCLFTQCLQKHPYLFNPRNFHTTNILFKVSIYLLIKTIGDHVCVIFHCWVSSSFCQLFQLHNRNPPVTTHMNKFSIFSVMFTKELRL